MKKVIRLNESDLHRIVKESVNQILNGGGVRTSNRRRYVNEEYDFNDEGFYYNDLYDYNGYGNSDLVITHDGAGIAGYKLTDYEKCLHDVNIYAITNRGHYGINTYTIVNPSISEELYSTTDPHNNDILDNIYWYIEDTINHGEEYEDFDYLPDEGKKEIYEYLYFQYIKKYNCHFKWYVQPNQLTMHFNKRL